MARPYVSEIRENERVIGTFLAVRKSLLTTKNGAPYLVITLADRTGEIEGRVWEDAERFDQAFEKGSYVKVDGVASAYNNRLQLKVERLRPVAREEIDPRDFVPSTRFDVDLMWTELRALVDAVADEWVRQILNAFLDDPEIGRRLREAPAAKNVHHPFVGGLLEHTLSVLQLAHRIADHYPRANRDLLVAGALLHDIGKTRELSYDAGIDYTTEGRLVGHHLIAIQWIHEKAAQIPGFPPELTMHLVHLVAAHHGQLEFGSPKVPHTLEAMIVHAIDELDSKVQAWTMIMDRDGGTEWTAYQKLYDRYLYKQPGWGREKAGFGPAPEGPAWQGLSLYRREALNLLGPSTPTSDGARSDDEPPREPARGRDAGEDPAPVADAKTRRRPTRPVPVAQATPDVEPASPEPAPLDLFALRGRG